MRLLARVTGYLALIAAGLIGLRIRSMNTALLWPAKLVAAALTFPAALLGAVGLLLGWRSGARSAAWAGATGAALALFYLNRITSEPRSFDRAFGTDWRARITPGQRARMLQRRWSAQLPPTHDPRITRDIAYHTPPGTDHPLLCDIWQPPWDVRPSGLAYLYVHGGGWCYGYRDFNTAAAFRRLTAQGHVVMDVDYRLAPGASLDDMLADIRQAILWMKRHAAHYGVNPARVVIAGGSAGAHLALLAAYMPPSPDADTSVRAVVAFYPPVDLHALHTHGEQLYDDHHPGRTLLARAVKGMGILRPDEEFIAPSRLVPRLLGGTPDDAPERYTMASPLAYVGDHCPPTLLLHGQHDCLVPVENSRILHNALLAKGVEVALIEYPFTDHGFDLALPHLSPSAQAAFYDLERFLALLA